MSRPQRPNTDEPRTSSQQLDCIRVQTSPIHGNGVFATALIAKDTCIIEYEGKRITQEEADQRAAKKADNPSHTFLFSLSNGMIIDGGDEGGDARWINHSCDPNCEAREENDRVFICALRDINVGEELHYSYRIDLPDVQTASLKKTFECRCAAENCLKTMLGEGPSVFDNRFTVLDDQEGVILKVREPTGCAAALSTILNFQHGVSIQEQDVAHYLSEQLRLSERVSFLQMKHFIQTLGLVGTGYQQLTLQQLIDLAPAIVVVDLDPVSHFTVFRGVLDQHVILADPVYGNIAMPLKKFKSAWNGKTAFVVSAAK